MFNKITIIIFLIVISIVSSAGCSLIEFKIGPEVNSDKEFTLINRQQEIGLTKKHDPKNNGKEHFEWGLALSGGGYRSATFGIGVMKSLYDMGNLKDIEVISAVSGGTYAAYWLLTSSIEDGVFTGSEFGGSVFSSRCESGNDFCKKKTINENFLVKTCELMTRANFVTYKDIVESWFRSYDAPKMYRCKIERSFGHGGAGIDEGKALNQCLYDAPESQSVKVHNMREAVEKRYIPYFIFNATLSEIGGINYDNNEMREPIDNGWRNGLYEFTPLYRGNKYFDYVNWEEKNSMYLSNISAISGAAVKLALKQKIDSHMHAKIQNKKIELSDGGHSENLGVVALVRRGVKNVIVVDAEHDKELTLEGYFILKDRLKAWGLLLKNDVLDSRERVEKTVVKTIRTGKTYRIKKIADQEKFWRRDSKPNLVNGEFIAKVFTENGKLVSTLYFVKMSVIGELKNELGDQYFSYIKGMKESKELLSQNARIRKYLDDNKQNNGNWSCNTLKEKSEEFDVIKWAMEEVAFRANSKWADNFPHYTTADQSYYTDQFLSYIGLGYLQGKRVSKLIEEARSDFRH